MSAGLYPEKGLQINGEVVKTMLTSFEEAVSEKYLKIEINRE